MDRTQEFSAELVKFAKDLADEFNLKFDQAGGKLSKHSGTIKFDVIDMKEFHQDVDIFYAYMMECRPDIDGLIVDINVNGKKNRPAKVIGMSPTAKKYKYVVKLLETGKEYRVGESVIREAITKK